MKLLILASFVPIIFVRFIHIIARSCVAITPFAAEFSTVCVHYSVSPILLRMGGFGNCEQCCFEHSRVHAFG